MKGLGWGGMLLPAGREGDRYDRVTYVAESRGESTEPLARERIRSSLSGRVYCRRSGPLNFWSTSLAPRCPEA